MNTYCWYCVLIIVNEVQEFWKIQNWFNVILQSQIYLMQSTVWLLGCFELWKVSVVTQLSGSRLVRQYVLFVYSLFHLGGHWKDSFRPKLKHIKWGGKGKSIFFHIELKLLVIRIGLGEYHQFLALLLLLRSQKLECLLSIWNLIWIWDRASLQNSFYEVTLTI